MKHTAKIKMPRQITLEIESHLELASFILNQEGLQTACRQIQAAREDLKLIREKASRADLNDYEFRTRAF